MTEDIYPNCPIWQYPNTNLEIEQLIKERDHARDEAREVKAEIKQLTKERDEARREVCRLMSMFNAESSVEIAASRSWDCFKEEKK
jgi:predicted  nucleic acid-binding Zn-ribbon protein